MIRFKKRRVTTCLRVICDATRAQRKSSKTVSEGPFRLKSVTRRRSFSICRVPSKRDENDSAERVCGNRDNRFRTTVYFNNVCYDSARNGRRNSPNRIQCGATRNVNRSESQATTRIVFSSMSRFSRGTALQKIKHSKTKGHAIERESRANGRRSTVQESNTTNTVQQELCFYIPSLLVR